MSFLPNPTAYLSAHPLVYLTSHSRTNSLIYLFVHSSIYSFIARVQSSSLLHATTPVTVLG